MRSVTQEWQAAITQDPPSTDIISAPEKDDKVKIQRLLVYKCIYVT